MTTRQQRDENGYEVRDLQDPKHQAEMRRIEETESG